MNNATDGFRSTGGAGSSIAYPQNPLNTSQGERGLSGNDFPNVVGISFDYKFPDLVHSGFLSRLTNGFDLYGLYRFNSGQVYTPYQPLTLDSITGDTSFCDGGFNAQTVGADTCRLVSSNRKAAISTVAYLNPYTGPVVGGAPPPVTRNTSSTTAIARPTTRTAISSPTTPGRQSTPARRAGSSITKPTPCRLIIRIPARQEVFPRADLQ